MSLKNNHNNSDNNTALEEDTIDPLTSQSTQIDASVDEQRDKKKRRLDKVLNILLIVAVVVFVATFFIRGYVVASVRIQMTSMLPTYDSGDRVWVDKTRSIVRGSVVVFYEEEVESKFVSAFTDSDKKLIKRVVAIEGDTLWVEQQSNGRFAVKIRTAQGQLLEEDYYTKNDQPIEIEQILRSALYRLSNHIGEENAYTIPEGYFFAMGDNRNNSRDSRSTEIGDIPISHLFGTVID